MADDQAKPGKVLRAPGSGAPAAPSPAAGAAPGGVPATGGGAGKAQEAAKLAETGKKLKEAESGAERVEHGSRAVGDAGKHAGGAWGAGIGAAGQGVSEVAKAKQEGATAGEQTRAGVSGAAAGAAGGALGGKDGGAAEAAVKKATDKKGGDDRDDKRPGDGRPSESGGTGPASGGPVGSAEADSSGGLGKEPGPMGKAAGVAAGVGAAQGAAQIGTALMILNYLKTMLMGLMAMGMNLLNTVIGAVLAAASKVVGFFGSIGAGISAAAGGLVSGTVAAALVVGGLTVAGGAGVAVVASGVVAANAAARDTAMVCDVSSETIKKQAESSGEGVEANTLANAQTVYSVLSAWGMSDENIAGILGNWKAESGVDPTSVQNHSDPRFQMSDGKQSAAGDANNGIGLGQWTFERNTNLRAFATASKKDWWTIETQLAYMIGPDSGADVIKDMIKVSEGSPGKAAKKFHDDWERSADTDISHREKAASEFFAMTGSWEKNASLADSILQQANVTLDGANTEANNSIKAAQACEVPEADELAGLKEGGLDLEAASKFMEFYKANGLTQLLAMYPAGGPGDCGNNDKSDNCVGFSTWFFNSYTTNKQYPMGNGLDTAKAVAALVGTELSSTPTVYSVFSVPGNVAGFTFAEGHTGVVLGIEGDKMIVGEANCGSNHARTHAIEVPIAQAQAQGWQFADVSEVLDKEAMKSVGK